MPVPEGAPLSNSVLPLGMLWTEAGYCAFLSKSARYMVRPLSFTPSLDIVDKMSCPGAYRSVVPSPQLLMALGVPSRAEEFTTMA